MSAVPAEIKREVERLKRIEEAASAVVTAVKLDRRSRGPASYLVTTDLIWALRAALKRED